MNITFNYGPDGSLARTFPEGTTVAGALNQGIRAGLGVPENVSVIVDGVTRDTSYVLQDGDDIVFETAPAQKA